MAPDDVGLVWPHAKRFIESAIARVPSDYTLDYVERKLQKNESQLWVAFASGPLRLIAAMTTEICGLLDTDKRVCVITEFGSDDFDLVERFLPALERYAKMEDCKLIRLYGRPGWIRRLRDHGYEQPWIALEKQVR